MIPNPQHDSLLAQSHELQQSIGWLADLEATERPILSCYLDLARGPLGGWERLQQRVSELRSSLPRPVMAQVDASMRDIESRLTTTPAQVRGLAVFARDDGPRSVFMPIPLAVPCETRLAISGVANIGPLVRLSNDYSRFLLMWARADSIQVTEVDLGVTSLRAWSATPHLIAIDGELQPGAKSRDDRSALRSSMRAYRAVERQLRSNRHLPLVLAGVPGLIPTLRARFNRALRSRLVAQLEVLPEQPYSEVVDCALIAFSTYRRNSASELGSHLVRALQGGRTAVAGADATLTAIGDGSVETLVMVDDAEPLSYADASKASSRPATEHTRHERAELTRLAIRLGVPMEWVGKDHPLRDHGGVGCLLNRPGGLGAESVPRRSTGLPRVA